ncbi:uncharacterized protein NPIL_671571 [Nephila pilipes]|uniref:Uncharacterized protein n=1 Tax=Nephila pilipes TaxID=299642 RepID=A0A8X6NQI8_NEPPI|nr:uncharacterized protein NPIL_671571 [Nephila pilipes]
MLFVPSLKDIVAAKIAITLYNDCEILHLCKETKLYLSPEEDWKVIIKKKLPDDVYPLSLQEKIMSLMKPISYEVEKWKEQHETFTGNQVDQRITSKFHWKADGTIDRLKTASSLIQSDVLQMRHRFRLACNYWQEESVLSIWEQMTASLRNYFCYTEMYDYLESDFFSNINVLQWIRWHTQIGNSNIREKKWFLDYIWNSVSLQGLLPQKLTPDERLELINCAFERNCDDHSSRFCVLLMPADQRLEVIKKNPYKVLRSFLLWPGQRMFIEMANHVKNNLTQTNFLDLLIIILFCKILSNWEDFDYFKLLREFWSLIPNECKEFLKRSEIYEPIQLLVANGRLELANFKKKFLSVTQREGNFIEYALLFTNFFYRPRLNGIMN